MMARLLLLLALLGYCYCAPDCEAQAGPLTSLYYNSGRWVNIFGDVKFNCSGRVTRWQFYAKSYGTMSLAIWRPVRKVGGKPAWRFVGKNVVTVTKDQKDTTVEFCVPIKRQIYVRRDDVIGIMYPKGPSSSIPTDRGIIPYENDNDFQWPNPTGRTDGTPSLFPYSMLHNVQVYEDDLDLSKPQVGIRDFRRKGAFKAILDSDPCESNPCENCGTCRRVCGDHYKCECPPGIHGDRCQYTDACETQAGPIMNLPYNSGRWVNIFVDVAFTCDGNVTRWTFFAKSTGSMFLTVWRPNSTGDRWSFIGKNAVSVSEANRIYSIYIPKEDQIEAEKGDVIGIQYPREDPGSPIPTERGIIPYMNDADFPWDSPVAFANSTFPFSRLINPQIYDDDVDTSKPMKVEDLRDFNRKAAFAACINCPDPCC